MLIKIRKNVSKTEYQSILKYLQDRNINFNDISDDSNIVLITIGDHIEERIAGIYSFESVVSITETENPYKIIKKENDEDIVINLPYGNKVSDDGFFVIAGPCSVESEKSLRFIAEAIKKSGAHAIRGGAYKLRTSPYTFQGLEEEGLKILSKVGKEFELVTVSEITSINQLPLFLKYVDIIQIGTRNMYNYDLLKALGKVNKPVLLKRAFTATIEEWLLSAEYIALGGNKNIILCERGIRSFDKETRNVLDLGAVLRLKELTYLKVIVDPSHATGRYEMVPKLTLAALSCGADGIMVEVHENPALSLSDGAESLRLSKFDSLMTDAKKIARVLGKKIWKNLGN